MTREPNGVSQGRLGLLFRLGTITGLSDGQLLERFATHGGEEAEFAFEAIVERHGPMVYRVCRGILRDEHAAQDAFQATFLILLHKGATLWVRDSLGPWLHRVACRAAGRARLDSNRRRVHEQEAAEQGRTRQTGEGPCDVTTVLHEEIDRLPNRYRIPVVLCDMEGHTYEEAARHMGCPVGTVRSRLARGREQLRGRLIRRGLVPSAGFLGVTFAAEAATAALPTGMVGSTTRVASHLLTGGATTAGEVPASVLKLVEGVQKVMLISKLKLVSASLLAGLGLATLGIGIGARAQQAQDRNAAPASVQVQPRPQQAPDGERPGVKTLPNGGTFEVIGISTHPSGPHTWWGPDGSPLAEPPCDPSGTVLGPTEGTITRVVVARVSNLPPDADQGWWLRNSGSSSGGRAVRNGKVIPDLKVAVAELSNNQATLTVHFQAATGPWQTVATLSGHSAAVGRAHDDLPSYMSSEAIATRKGTTLTVTHSIKDHAVRLVAVDRHGELHRSVGGGGVGLSEFSQLQAEFNLSPEQIQEYQLQRRPYQEAELPNIALNPTKAE